MFIGSNIHWPPKVARAQLPTRTHIEPTLDLAAVLLTFSLPRTAHSGVEQSQEYDIMSKRIQVISLTAMLFSTFGFAASVRSADVLTPPVHFAIGVSDTDRDRDGLLGPVRRIKTETVKLVSKAGKVVEGDRQVLETAAYDLKGTKTENAYFPGVGSTYLTGKETYKYDEKGNISEMTLFNADGSLLGKEVYTYEYDFVGNWTKMTTSVAVVEGGKLSLEPTEVTYRTITYYLDANLTKLTQPVATNVATPTSFAPSNSVSNSTANNAANTAPPKTDKPVSTTPPKLDTASVNKPSVSGQPLASQPAPAGDNKSGNKPELVAEVEPAAKPAPKPLMKPISGGVLNGKAISLPPPLYPEIARRMRAIGLVSVEVVIDVNGKVISAKAISGNSALQPAAVQAALRARFSPTTLSGQPVKVSGVINYNFTLSK